MCDLVATSSDVECLTVQLSGLTDGESRVEILRQMPAGKVAALLVPSSKLDGLGLFHDVWCEVLHRPIVSAIPEVAQLISQSRRTFVVERCTDLAGTLGLLSRSEPRRAMLAEAILQRLTIVSRSRSPQRWKSTVINSIEVLIELTGFEHEETIFKIVRAYEDQLLGRIEFLSDYSPAMSQLWIRLEAENAAK